MYNHNFKNKKNIHRSNDGNTNDDHGSFLVGDAEELRQEPSPQLLEFTFNGVHNNNYFKNEASGNLGSSYLVGRSHFKLDNVAKHVNLKEVDMHMNIATLVSQITRIERDLSAVILKQASILVYCSFTIMK